MENKDLLQCVTCDCFIENDKLKQQRDDLLAAFKKYGGHTDDCNLCSVIPCVKRNGKKIGCTCGFEAAISAAKS